jgi:cytochrome c-type biogenesis protein CcmH/NrfF
MTLFGHPSSWLLWGLTWLVLMLVTALIVGVVARGVDE